jgi:signal transduction histidine kinase
LFKRGNKVKRGFSPVYLAILSGVILIILIINGFLEIRRTQNGFYLLLKREAVVLVQHYEKNIEEAIVSLQQIEEPSGSPMLNPSLSGFLFSMEESVGEYLVEAAFNVDQLESEKPLTSADLQSLAQQYGVTAIHLYDATGRSLKEWPVASSFSPPRLHLKELIERKRSVVIDLFGKPPAGENHGFSVAVWRKETPGIVALHLSAEQLKSLYRQFAIQRAITDIRLKEDILSVSVLDSRLNILAHTDSAFIGKKEEDVFLKHSLQVNQSVSRVTRSDKGEAIFEVVKSFSINGTPMGLIRIVYSPKEIDPVLRQIKKNVILSILFFLILGVSAITLIGVNQNRHLKRMKEMEDRIRLAERLSSLGHLAAGVAHEIRNPLNAMGMGLQRLKREFLPQDESKKEEYLAFTEVILKEIRRVNEIVEQFLGLARPFHLEPKISSLQELLKRLIALFQEEATAQGVMLQEEMDPQLPLITMDEGRLTQAFINIMKNGIQAMDHGGVLRIEAHSSKDRVRVVIADSGSGISPDRMEKIFNYYYTTKENGVGLGLPIAHRIIEAHGGQLEVESQVGSGTRVTITLPIEGGVPGG